MSETDIIEEGNKGESVVETNVLPLISYTRKCINGCCIEQHRSVLSYTYKRTNRKKAGVFIYDMTNKKVLLVKSKNNFWGAPKGAVNPNETIIAGAIREVKEETGISFTKEQLKRYVILSKKIYFFYVDIPECEVQIQTNVTDEANDVCGICWYKIDCLQEAVKQKKISLTTSCKQLLKRILNVNV